METVNEQGGMEGKYKVIYVDAPWEDKAWPIHRVRGLAVESWVAADALMLMWVPNELLPEVLHLLQGWGFNYECLLAWRKPKEPVEVCWFRGHCEFIVVAKRGTVRTSYLMKHTLYEGSYCRGESKPEGFRTLLSVAGDIAFGEGSPQLDVFGDYWKERIPDYRQLDWEFVKG